MHIIPQGLINISNDDPYLDAWGSKSFRALLDLLSYATDSWRRYTFVGVSGDKWGVSLTWGVGLGASEYPGKEVYLWGLGGGRKLYMMTRHSCHISPPSPIK